MRIYKKRKLLVPKGGQQFGFDSGGFHFANRVLAAIGAFHSPVRVCGLD